MEKILTIGSIVKVKYPDNLLFMIAGYFPKKEERIYDYSAVPFPFGLIDENQFLCFDRDEILKVMFESYTNNHAKDILTGVNELSQKLKNFEKH